MAAMHGKGGTGEFTDGGTVVLTPINLLTWSVDTAANVAEITDMGDTWKTYLAGFKTWTATLECLTDGAGSDATAIVGGSGTLTIDTAADGGLAFSGTALCTSAVTNTEADGAVKSTYTFKGQGALAEA